MYANSVDSLILDRQYDVLFQIHPKDDKYRAYPIYIGENYQCHRHESLLVSSKWPKHNSLSHVVYEFWDQEQESIYIGYTNQIGKRIDDHWKEWGRGFSKCDGIPIHLGIIVFDTQEEALSEERDRIQKYEPTRNIQYLPTDKFKSKASFMLIPEDYRRLPIMEVIDHMWHQQQAKNYLG